MPRNLRSQDSGASNHVMNRGDQRQPILNSAAESAPSISRKPSRSRRWLAGLAITVVVAVAALYAQYRHRYPYGSSHCCDLLLIRALQEYAASHGGDFPTGGPTPEASLSLLYSNVDWVTLHLLRGKTVPLAVAEAAFKRDGRLGPDSCGWHYVDGLRVDDDPGLAIFWDKIPLGHNGQRRTPPVQTVFFVGGEQRFVPESKWPEFLAEQARLLQQRTNSHSP